MTFRYLFTLLFISSILLNCGSDQNQSEAQNEPSPKVEKATEKAKTNDVTKNTNKNSNRTGNVIDISTLTPIEGFKMHDGKYYAFQYPESLNFMGALGEMVFVATAENNLWQMTLDDFEVGKNVQSLDQYFEKRMKLYTDQSAAQTPFDAPDNERFNKFVTEIGGRPYTEISRVINDDNERVYDVKFVIMENSFDVEKAIQAVKSFTY